MKVVVNYAAKSLKQGPLFIPDQTGYIFIYIVPTLPHTYTGYSIISSAQNGYYGMIDTILHGQPHPASSPRICHVMVSCLP